MCDANTSMETPKSATFIRSGRKHYLEVLSNAASRVIGPAADQLRTAIRTTRLQEQLQLICSAGVSTVIGHAVYSTHESLQGVKRLICLDDSYVYTLTDPIGS